MSYAARMRVACNITGERIRKLRAAAKARGRMVEAWCQGAPYLTVYPDGRLKLSGRGLSGFWPFGKKKPKRRVGDRTIYFVPGRGHGAPMTKRGYGVMRGARRRRRRR